jgi:ribokinase
VDNLVTSVSESTGCAFVTIDERGENTITIGSGANASITEVEY